MIPALQKKLEADVAIISNLQSSTNFYYLTRMSVGGILIVPSKKKPFLLTNKMDYEKANGSSLPVLEWKKNLFNELPKILSMRNIPYATISIVKKDMTVALFEKLKKSLKGTYKDISPTLAQMRMLKSRQEIKYIKKACTITDKVFSKLVEQFPFTSEQQIRYFIDSEILKHGAEPAFATIVASGRHGSIPHYDKRGRLLKGFLVLDFGARYQGYCSDMSRTIYLGEPSRQELKVYNKLLSVQEECIEASKRMNCAELYQHALDLLGEKRHHFLHSLGHGLGLAVHEGFGINEKENQKLQEGMIFTIEPGLYFPRKFGIRIEDTILMEDQPKVLTKSPKQLIMVKRWNI